MNSLLTEIKKVADQIRGVTYGANDAIDKPQNGYIGLLRANNIQNNCLNFDDLLYVPSHKVSSLQILKRGDILIAASSGSLSIVGKAGVFKSDEKYTFGAFCKAIRPRTNIDAPYLSHYFFTTEYRTIISSLAAGANINNLRNEHIDNLSIPLPPLAEQQRIAALLDTADRILKQRESAIAKLDQLAESVFVEMFGSINGNEKKFEQMKLTEFFKFKTGKLDSNAAIENGIYPFFTCSKEDFAINEYAFDEEALLLAGNNATADYSVKHYKGKFNAYQRTYVINLAESNNSYAYAKACLQLKLIQLKSVSKGTNTKYLTMGIFREMTMNVPPKNLQIDFEKRIHAIDLVKSKNKEDLKSLKKLIDSLQHQSFVVN